MQARARTWVSGSRDTRARTHRARAQTWATDCARTSRAGAGASGGTRASLAPSAPRKMSHVEQPSRTTSTMISAPASTPRPGVRDQVAALDAESGRRLEGAWRGGQGQHIARCFASTDLEGHCRVGCGGAEVL
eukprot:4685257-Pleurochrysis_carterae.AAC.5